MQGVYLVVCLVVREIEGAEPGHWFSDGVQSVFDDQDALDDDVQDPGSDAVRDHYGPATETGLKVGPDDAYVAHQCDHRDGADCAGAG